MGIQRWPRCRIEDVRWIAQATPTLIHFRSVFVLFSVQKGIESNGLVT